MKNIKMMSLILMLLFIISSCGEQGENINKTVEVEKNVEGEGFRNKSVEKTEEEIKKDIQESVRRNLRQAKSADVRIIAEKLKKCEGEEEKQICKNIVIEIEAENQKNINFCEKHSEEKEVKRCKNRVASKLASRELDTKYCGELEAFEKQECERGVKESLEREVERVKLEK